MEVRVFLSGFRGLLRYRRLSSPDDYAHYPNDDGYFTLYYSCLSLAFYIIDLVMLFLVSYSLGRNLDVKAELQQTIISIFLGGFIGYFLGFDVGFSAMEYLALGELSPVNILVTALPAHMVSSFFTALGIFFVSFSAIAIAYFRTRKEKPEMPNPPQASPRSREVSALSHYRGNFKKMGNRTRLS